MQAYTQIATNDLFPENDSDVPLSQPVDISNLPVPPNQGMNIYRNIRDTLSYLKDPDRFVADRTAKLGPVFLAYQFFKPIVYCGGQKAAKEFISGAEIKSEAIHPKMPDPFVDLHTKWGALNLDINDKQFKQARQLFGDIFSSREALDQYSQVAERDIQEYVNDLVERVGKDPEQPIYLAPELKSLCLDMFAKKISGQGLSDKQKQQFIDYNQSLLSLSTRSQQYKKGRAAIDALKVDMLKRFHNSAGTPGEWYRDQILGRVGFEDEDRIASEMVLYIWAAYAEGASLMVNALVLSHKHELDLDNVRDELASRKATGILPSEQKFWNDMPYTNGVVRESLRTETPAAGIPRHGNKDFELSGYRIPAGIPVMLDPRIGNMDPGLYQDPQVFEPLRWVPSNNSAEEASISSCPIKGTALKLGVGSWFPGGAGPHQCPGVPIAEMVSRVFLAKMATEFDSWSYYGDGLTKDGELKFNKIPLKIAPDNFGMLFKLRDETQPN